MKIIFIPDYTQVNPYQSELSAGLKKFDIDVRYEHGSGLFRLIRSIIKHKASIIHIHWIDSLIPHSTNSIKIFFKKIALIIDLNIIKFLGIKIFWTVHNKISHECSDYQLEIFTRKLLSKKCDKIIIHCENVMKEIAEFYEISENKFSVIPHGHYINNYINKIDKLSARRKLNIPYEAIVYLSMGSIREYKGYGEFINDFKQIKNKDLYLIIVGKPFNDQIAVEIKSQIKDFDNMRTVFDYVPAEDVQIYMNAADAVILPYKMVLNSGVAVLAMSFSKAVIAPRMGCLPSVLDEKGSFLYDPKFKSGLADEIRKSMSSDLEKMGHFNFDRIKQNDWYSIAKKTLNLYQNTKP